MGTKTSKKIEDRLFLECDNGCAVCGYRDVRVLTIHHIDHESKTKNNSYDNLIILCHNCHEAYHQKKGVTKSEIVKTKRRLVLKTLTPFGVSALKIASRKTSVVGAPFTLLHLVELGLLKEDEGVMTVSDSLGNEVEAQTLYMITPKGKEFYEKWVK